ncbi:MAG: sigma factor-like helix-turn-helix DNA-binding protein [Acidimicrobiia bacterium]
MILFDPWYRELHPRLVAALTLVAADRDLAQDAADEALVRALERWSRVGQMDSPDGWTYRVAVNDLRRRARRRLLERRVVSPVPLPPPATVAVEVWEAVRSLPRRQREAIGLRYLLDLPEAEVAAAMGVAVGTASATLAAARARLAALLSDPGDAGDVVTGGATGAEPAIEIDEETRAWR